VTGARILVVEDDADIRRSLQILLRRAGFDPVLAADGPEGLRCFSVDAPELVLLDINLPVLDGWAVLERIRDVSRVPVILLTARGLEADKIRGLRGGADDYMTKPFGNNELVARIGALLRRLPSSAPEPPIYRDDLLGIDFAHREVRVRDVAVDLTPAEFQLLYVLVRHAGQVLSPTQLLEQAWRDPSGTSPGRVKFTVFNLRRKLGWEDLQTCPLENVRGFGYRYRRPGDGG
jgi:DNA-binding response OmpR family regulator